MRSIRFVVGAAPYNAGEVACFDDADAERYVKMRIAVYANPAPTAVPAAPVTRENPVATQPTVPAVTAQVPRQPVPQVNHGNQGNQGNRNNRPGHR